MKILLIGPPGTGKGTQAKFIKKKYNIPEISIGDMLRKNVKLNNDIGKKIIDIIKKGKLVSDSIIFHIVQNRIEKKDCFNGFLLDGFPRTIRQAIYMSKKNIKIDYILEFIIPEKLIWERILGRRIHIPSGRIYHIKFNPPKKQDQDDITGELLTIRNDDTMQIVKKRISEYKKHYNILNQYYHQEQKKGNIKYFQINSEKSVSEIRKKIELILI